MNKIHNQIVIVLQYITEISTHNSSTEFNTSDKIKLPP